MSADAVHRKQLEAQQTPKTLSNALHTVKERRPYRTMDKVVITVAFVAFVCLTLQVTLYPPYSSSREFTASRQERGLDVPDAPEDAQGVGGEAVAGGARGALRLAQHGTVPWRGDIMKVATPFKDLCEWVTRGPMSTVGADVSASGLFDAELRAQLESAMDRFDHIPADGGAAGRRWSAATGLPLASHRTGDVKVRFMTVSNRLDPMMHFASVTAAMAGVRLEMIGKGWKHFSFVKRLSLLLSYAEVEGLSDADVIVATDADAVMSGEDAESFFAAFVASTAASEEEHVSYALRDIRTGKRMAPVLFSSEQSCFHIQVIVKKDCAPTYRKYRKMFEQWAESANVSYQPSRTAVNPFLYLNAGVMVTRVWALRRLAPAFINFAKTHTPKRKMIVNKQWWCDQATFGTLYLDLIWWELRSNALDGAPKRLSASLWQESLFPPEAPLPAGRAPHDLIGGLIGIDESVRLSVTLNPHHSPPRAFRINGNVIKVVRRPESPLVAALAKGMPLGVSPVGVVRSRHEFVLTPRLNVDCAGVASVPPECAYRDAVVGIPEGATAVVPLMWHYASPSKHRVYLHYRTLFSWYTPALRNASLFHTLERVVASLPPTRVFSIDPETNTGEYLGKALLLPHNDSDDVSVVDMCVASVLKLKT